MKIPPLLAVVFLTLSTGFAHAAESASKPNIVIILADDLGYGSVGCFGADGKLVRTPNIDRLAREGRRFTDANTTSSVCTPTRYSLLTGRYCWRTSLKYETLNTFAPMLIEPGRYNMASMLKAHGYHTASIGKWHLGYGDAKNDPKYRVDYTAELTPGPQELGFDYHFSVPQNHGDITGVFVENHFVYGLRSGKIPADMKLPGPVPDDENFASTYYSESQQGRGKTPMEIDAPRRVDDRVMPELTDQAVHWIEQQKAGTPFFLYFAPVAVHEPVTPSRDTKGTSQAGRFGDWIHELDRTVGRVLDTLDKQGLTQDTLVIFTSDNGGIFEPGQQTRPETLAVQAGLSVNGQWRGGKTHVFEGGFKVPFIARWPGKVPSGTECREMISLADVLATTAAIVGEKLPPAYKAAEDSYNILPALLGEKLDAPLRPDMVTHSNDGVFAIRKGPWKWIEGVPVSQISPGLRKAHAPEFQRQLYNLQDDPQESKDVSEQHPEIVKELEAMLHQQRDAGHTRELPRTAAAESHTDASQVVDATSMHKKVMSGYQGWFRCPGDASNMGWIHYSRGPITPASLTFEMWPDVHEFSKDERFAAPGFTLPDGSPAELFSSDNAATVQRHFEWMRDYGIDGVYLQHFLLDMPGAPAEDRYDSRRRVLDHVRRAAEQTGRVWAISFDAAGTPADRIFELLTTEWRRLVDEKITANPRYLHEQGLPVVQIWGFYWKNPSNHMTAEVAEKLIAFFKQPGPYAAFLAGGGDWDWRRNTDPAWQAFYRKFGAYSPWNVGNAPTNASGEKFAAIDYWADDKRTCEQNGVFWLPVVYAGFSWDNLQQKSPGTTNIPRRGGKFLWEQLHALSGLGADSIYVAMFDEIDEGTAIFKVTSAPPTQGHFVGYEGLPSDWYLRLAGEGGRLLKQRLPVPAEIPIQP
ncbi:MAG: sulfatase-like hydrolase/transferase [Chthoniobacter sp.]|nr:sulfatase-like hydrolase/transferase [Chthoniobacter sp.]